MYKLLDVGDKRKPYPEIFLGILAVLLFACAVIGASKYGLDDKVAVGVVAAALLLAVLAAFSSQVEGNLRLGKHFEIPIAARRTKQQSQKSKAPEAKDDPAPVDSADEYLRKLAISDSLPPWTGTRNVRLIDDAVPAMAALTPHERALVRGEMERISRPDFDIGRTDPMTIRSGKSPGGKRHPVPGSDITIFYWCRLRERANEPQTVDVASIVKNLDG
ncbi:hypothetical protein AN931_20145 [Mycobacterium intracellulare subsp. chimaera]|nr:hypothetical protein AN480_24640 [Mycobacterium intracellulare subsp. chimaera]ARV84444.1 hypothetical protein BWK49_26335 [Mycobacterium intracellulare subsp. chimaera]ASL11783.1 hypothetical protein MYCODSM44623_05105 [Mycobacterium intracellulare subsp. chimaera]ASL23733.1 hypothetical protein MYCOZU1_05366 [Mycobacterium intracellulare subsp. chimaera]KPN50680.1 hypothetical protein AN931_20145 [Mycobacterium intracellulare subsp. chimaera]